MHAASTSPGAGDSGCRGCGGPRWLRWAPSWQARRAQQVKGEAPQGSRGLAVEGVCVAVTDWLGSGGGVPLGSMVGTVQDLGDSPGLGGMWGREKKWGTARHSRRVPGQDVAPWGITPLNKPRNRILASQACNTGLPGTAQGVPGSPRLDPESQVRSIRSLGAPCQGCSQEILLWGRPWRFGSRVLLGTAVG